MEGGKEAEPLANPRSLCRFLLCFRPSFLLVNALIYAWPKSVFLSKTFAILAACEWTFKGSLWTPPTIALSERFVSLDQSDWGEEQITFFASSSYSGIRYYKHKFVSIPKEQIVRCFSDHNLYLEPRIIIEDKTLNKFLTELRVFANVTGKKFSLLP